MDEVLDLVILTNHNMVATTIGALLGGAYSEVHNNCLYVVRDGVSTLYVGKTTQASVSGRLWAHLGKGPAFMKISRLGQYIEESMPASEKWPVEILTREDWNAIFDAAGLSRRYKLNTAESALIRLYRPVLNRTSHPDHIRPLPWIDGGINNGT